MSTESNLEKVTADWKAAVQKFIAARDEYYLDRSNDAKKAKMDATLTERDKLTVTRNALLDDIERMPLSSLAKQSGANKGTTLEIAELELGITKKQLAGLRRMEVELRAANLDIGDLKNQKSLITVLGTQRDDLQKKVDDLTDELERAKSERVQQAKKTSELTAELQIVKSTISSEQSELYVRLQEADENRKQLVQDTRVLGRDKEELQTKLAAQAAEAENWKTKAVELQTTVDKLQDSLKNEKTKLKLLQAKIDTLKAQLRAKTTGDNSAKNTEDDDGDVENDTINNKNNNDDDGDGENDNGGEAFDEADNADEIAEANNKQQENDFAKDGASQSSSTNSEQLATELPAPSLSYQMIVPVVPLQKQKEARNEIGIALEFDDVAKVPATFSISNGASDFDVEKKLELKQPLKLLWFEKTDNGISLVRKWPNFPGAVARTEAGVLLQTETTVTFQTASKEAADFADGLLLEFFGFVLKAFPPTYATNAKTVNSLLATVWTFSFAPLVSAFVNAMLETKSRSDIEFAAEFLVLVFFKGLIGREDNPKNAKKESLTTREEKGPDTNDWLGPVSPKSSLIPSGLYMPPGIASLIIASSQAADKSVTAGALVDTILCASVFKKLSAEFNVVAANNLSAVTTPQFLSDPSVANRLVAAMTVANGLRKLADEKAKFAQFREYASDVVKTDKNIANFAARRPQKLGPLVITLKSGSHMTAASGAILDVFRDKLSDAIRKSKLESAVSLFVADAGTLKDKNGKTLFALIDSAPKMREYTVLVPENAVWVPLKKNLSNERDLVRLMKRHVLWSSRAIDFTKTNARPVTYATLLYDDDPTDVDASVAISVEKTGTTANEYNLRVDYPLHKSTVSVRLLSQPQRAKKGVFYIVGEAIYLDNPSIAPTSGGYSAMNIAAFELPPPPGNREYATLPRNAVTPIGEEKPAETASGNDERTKALYASAKSSDKTAIANLMREAVDLATKTGVLDDLKKLAATKELVLLLPPRDSLRQLYETKPSAEAARGLALFHVVEKGDLDGALAASSGEIATIGGAPLQIAAKSAGAGTIGLDEIGASGFVQPSGFTRPIDVRRIARILEPVSRTSKMATKVGADSTEYRETLALLEATGALEQLKKAVNNAPPQKELALLLPPSDQVAALLKTKPTADAALAVALNHVVLRSRVDAAVRACEPGRTPGVPTLAGRKLVLVCHQTEMRLPGAVPAKDLVPSLLRYVSLPGFARPLGVWRVPQVYLPASTPAFATSVVVPSGADAKRLKTLNTTSKVDEALDATRAIAAGGSSAEMRAAIMAINSNGRLELKEKTRLRQLLTRK